MNPAMNLDQQNKETQLNKIRKDVEEIVDALGHPVDEGIKPTVVILNALNLPTTQSCEGHLDGYISGPWVDIGPEIPTAEKWYEDDETRNRLRQECLAIRTKFHELLQLFYQEHQVDYDAMLQHAELGYHVRLQSNASELLGTLDSEAQKQALLKYQTEMERFTAFLTKRYLRS